MAQKLTLTIIFIFCFVAQVLPVIRSGTQIENGVGFWGPNGHDGVWHLALINQISNPFKINMPIMSGEILKNYHPFFDIIIATFIKITSISPSILLFQIFPLVSTFFYLYFSYKVGKLITGTNRGGLTLILLNSLSNSFGFIVTIFKNGNTQGESLFWAMQSTSNQLNPPFILSLVLILALINTLLSNPKKLTKIQQFLVVSILTFLPIIKAYSAIPAFTFFLFYCLSNYKYKKTFFISLFLAVVLFLQFNKNSSALLVWQPFWFIRSLFESTDKLYFPRFANLAQATFIKKIIFYLIGIPIFYLGNFGFRTLSTLKSLPNNWFKHSINLSIIVLAIIPLFFIQSGTSWNTIQFLYFALFLSNLTLAYFLSKTNILLSVIIISIQLIPLFSSFPQYLGKNPPAFISNQEIACLNYLKSQPKSIVLTYPYDAFVKDKLVTPIPLYAYTTTSYVSAFSSQITYLEDEMNLGNSGYDWQDRRKSSETFFKQENQYQDRGFLLNNKIDYIYLTGNQPHLITFNTNNIYIKNIYQNDICQIYQVIK